MCIGPEEMSRKRERAGMVGREPWVQERGGQQGRPRPGGLWELQLDLWGFGLGGRSAEQEREQEAARLLAPRGRLRHN